MIDLNGIRLRNRVVTSSTFMGYGAPPRGSRLAYGMSPVGQFLDLRRFGAVTIRTLSHFPREGHFSLQQTWTPLEWPHLVRKYLGALRPVDAGWMNAFGWCNIGIEAYFDDYYPRTHHLNRIISVGGFSADEFRELVEIVNEKAAPGEIAAVEFNVSCHNVNFDFVSIMDDVLSRAVPASRHPVILKLSPDSDYVRIARLAQDRGVAAVTAINAVKGLRLNPRNGQPLLKNGFGGLSGRCIKPIGLRVVAELREAIDLPIIATAGIRDYDDCREYFWAGADVVSLGSAALLPSPLDLLVPPLHAARLTRLIGQVERCDIPDRARARRPALEACAA
jgi:dihydroorotate dehydrogenase (NAD+) catalytic subunit